MTSAIDVRPGDKVLEVGTGSGFQSALLSYLTDRLFDRDHPRARGAHPRRLRPADRQQAIASMRRSRPAAATAITAGQDAAPFDKIIVTCGIDHIPPPLLQQLATGGIMVIPGRPARRAAYPQGGEDDRPRRRNSRCRARTFSAARSFRSCRCPAAIRVEARRAGGATRAKSICREATRGKPLTRKSAEAQPSVARA